MNESGDIPKEVTDEAKQGSRSRAVVRVLLRVTVSAALLIAVFFRVGDDALWQVLTRGLHRGAWLMVAIVGFPAIGYLVSMTRLRSLLQPHKILLPRREILRSQLMGTFFNQFLPTSIGGDAHRVWYLGRQSGQTSMVFSAIFLARILGVVALCLLAIGGIVLRPSWLGEVPALLYGVLAASGILVATVLTLALIRPTGRAHENAHKWQLILHKVTAALAQYRTAPIVLVTALTLSLVLQIELVLQYRLFVWCLQIDLSFFQLLVAIPLITLASMLPISFNGIGVREWVMIWICSPLGVSQADAAMVALLFLVAQLFYAMVGGVMLYGLTSSQRVKKKAGATQREAPADCSQ